jgi:uncharacterized protein YvpB
MEINLPDVVEEVTRAFGCYEAALTGNDVETLDALFWGGPHVVRYGVTENLHGEDDMRAFRKARPSRGLDRTLHDTVITTFGRDFATANTRFSRPGADRTGRQSHAWARLPEGWRIVAAHVSFMED